MILEAGDRGMTPGGSAERMALPQPHELVVGRGLYIDHRVGLLRSSMWEGTRACSGESSGETFGPR